METRLEQDDADIEGFLIDLKHAAKTPAKQRAIKISNVIDRLCVVAHDSGLSSTSLGKLVDIITLPNELDQSSLGALIRSLYPRGKVADDIVIKVVGCLGHGKNKPKYPAQTALLKWLVLVYDVLKNQRILSRLYAVLFNLIDTAALRSVICHVLSLITRRRHVRPHRIQVLMELTRQAGNEPALVGLLRVYKDYYPDVIVGDVTSGRASVFTHPNREWRDQLQKVQELNLLRRQDTRSSHQGAFRVTRKGTAFKRRNNSSIIPEVHTSHASENSITLEEIEDVDDFVQKLEQIEPPNQLVAALGDPLLQKFLQLRSQQQYSQRIDSWLMAFFEDQLQSPGTSENTMLGMLESIREYTQYTKELPRACLTYLRSMLHTWNGVTGREVVLDLLSYVAVGNFADLYSTLFQVAEDAVLDESTTQSQVALLILYQKLLDRWTISALANANPITELTTAVVALVNHVNVLSLTIIQGSQAVETCSSILTFYESAAAFITYPSLKSIARIANPPAELVYTLHFSSSLSTLSRLCAILAHYKRAFEVVMLPKQVNQKGHDVQTYPKEYLNHFNGFLMDLCNCLWRARALNTVDPNALGCLVSPPVTSTLNAYIAGFDSSITLQSLFGFSTSPVLCLLAISYVRELEDASEDSIDRRHAGPATQVSLKQLEMAGGVSISWQDYKLGVLQYVEKRGATGIGELMYNTMKHLMAEKSKRV